MKISHTQHLGICLIGFILLSTNLSARTWTTVEGSQSEGELLSVQDNQVTLRIDGREYLFPVTRFSEADRAYLLNWQKEERCMVCLKTVQGDQMKAGSEIYHPSCFTCLVCERPFMDRQAIRRDEWGGMVHNEHFRQAHSCGSCGRLISPKTIRPEQIFPDKRVSCLPCLKEAVSDVTQLQAVSRRVRLGLSELGLPTPTGVLSMKMVSQDTLNREIERAHGRGSLRGLTLTTFRTITGGPNAGTTFSHEVWVLSGLPVAECVSVLAHEFGHVWLNENYIDASPPAVEGFCNLLSMHALQKDTSKLADVLRKNLQMSDDYVYGRGFREMSKRLEKLGWSGLLNDLSTRRVPLTQRRR
ncbi:MAG: LIM domain-containing protein [Opitutales bacterium]